MATLPLEMAQGRLTAMRELTPMGSLQAELGGAVATLMDPCSKTDSHCRPASLQLMLRSAEPKLRSSTSLDWSVLLSSSQATPWPR